MCGLCITDKSNGQSEHRLSLSPYPNSINQHAYLINNVNTIIETSVQRAILALIIRTYWPGNFICVYSGTSSVS